MEGDYPCDNFFSRAVRLIGVKFVIITLGLCISTCVIGFFVCDCLCGNTIVILEKPELGFETENYKKGLRGFHSAL